MDESDLVELLHLSRLVGSLFVVQQVETAATDPLCEASVKLYRLIERLGFDHEHVLGLLNERSAQERAAHEQRVRKTELH